MTNHRICDECFDNAGAYLEDNVHFILAIPYLIEACRSAAEEIGTLCGSDNPHTQSVIDALNEAVAMTVKGKRKTATNRRA